jgi:hypothetical protein
MEDNKMTLDASVFNFNNGTHLDYLRTAYTFLIEAYQQLTDNNYDSKSKNENNLRDDLVRIAEIKKDTKLKFAWETESRDIINANRIDIKLITPYSLLDRSSSITIECKIIGEDQYIDNRNSFERKNPTNGIMSFITGKYAKHMPVAGMIGFSKEGKIQEKIKNLCQRLKKHKDINTSQNLTYYTIKHNFEYTYHSIHERNNQLKEISIYHLFFDYTM